MSIAIAIVGSYSYRYMNVLFIYKYALYQSLTVVAVHHTLILSCIMTTYMLVYE